MALIGSRRAFNYEYSARPSLCSECGARIRKGGPCLIARDGKGRTRKKVCSQECREAFDDKFWQGLVNTRLAKKAERIFCNLIEAGMTCEAALRAMEPELREAKEALMEEFD